MHEDTHTGVFTTVSAVAGGLGKLLVTKHLLLNININGLLTVSAYAAASAAVGYFVKLGLDWAARTVINYFNNREDDNE